MPVFQSNLVVFAVRLYEYVPCPHKEEYKLNYCALPKHWEWNGEGFFRPTLKLTEGKTNYRICILLPVFFLKQNILSVKKSQLQHDIKLNPHLDKKWWLTAMRAMQSLEKLYIA